jgi:hypothetical protein
MKKNVRRFNLIFDVVALIYFLIYLFLSYSIIFNLRLLDHCSLWLLLNKFRDK